MKIYEYRLDVDDPFSHPWRILVRLASYYAEVTNADN